MRPARRLDRSRRAPPGIRSANGSAGSAERWRRALRRRRGKRIEVVRQASGRGGRRKSRWRRRQTRRSRMDPGRGGHQIGKRVGAGRRAATDQIGKRVVGGHRRWHRGPCRDRAARWRGRRNRAARRVQRRGAVLGLELHLQQVAADADLVLLGQHDRLAGPQRAPTHRDRIGRTDVADRIGRAVRNDLGLPPRHVALRIGQCHRVVVGASDGAAARVEARGDRLRQRLLVEGYRDQSECHGRCHGPCGRRRAIVDAASDNINKPKSPVAVSRACSSAVRVCSAECGVTRQRAPASQRSWRGAGAATGNSRVPGCSRHNCSAACARRRCEPSRSTRCATAAPIGSP